MGNCLRSCTSEDNLVPEPQIQGDRRGPGHEPLLVMDLQEDPVSAAHPAPMQMQPTAQASEEEHVGRSQRVSLKQRLPKVFHDLGGDASECAICLDAVGGTLTRRLPCAHSYHLDCVGEWLTRSFTCPLCRRSAQVLPLESILILYETYV